jgi:serine/threonine protein kinase
VIMYEMCTGRVPFTGRPFEILEAAVTRPATPPSQISGPTSPPWLERVILQLMAKKPADRMQTATEVFNALDRGRSDIAPAYPSEEVTKIQPSPPLPSASAPASNSGALAKARRTRSGNDDVTEDRPRRKSGAPPPVVEGGPNYGVIVAGCGLVSLIASALLLAVTLVVVMLYA